MIRIAANDALTLAAFIRSDLAAIARIENHVSQLDFDDLNPAEFFYITRKSQPIDQPTWEC